METEILEKIELKHGSHKSIDEGACIMEMVSYMANEPWSDHPKCACPILTEYAIRLNDRFNDEHRQRLKEFVPLLIGTRATPEVQIARKRLFRWRNVTVTYPLILDLFKLTELADKLRSLGNNLDDMASAAGLLRESKGAIYKADNANAYANAYANAAADANAYADAAADANADADAYAYAAAASYADASYADAYAYAHALRVKVADAAIVTLRMAIEVKK